MSEAIAIRIEYVIDFECQGTEVLATDLSTSLVGSTRNCEGDLFPIVVLTVDSDGLDQEVVFFCSPGPADDFFRHDMWNRGDDENTERSAYVNTTPSWLDRLKLSSMSLVQDYSSGEEEDPVSFNNDAFGLASLPATKKPRTEPPKPTSVLPHSAPDVLSEVCNVFEHLNPRNLNNILTGSIETNFAYNPTNRYTNQREHHI